LQKLKSIKPSSKWLSLTRQKLVDELSVESNLKPSNSFFDWFWFHRLQPVALSLCLILIMAGGPVLAVTAAQSSLPGDLLYPIKKIAERVSLQVASEDNKAQIQVDLAYRRIEELNKIAVGSSNQIEKSQKTKVVVDDLKVSISEAGQKMMELSKDKVAVIAKKTQKIETDLTKVKNEIASEIAVAEDESLKEVQDVLAEAEQMMEDVNKQIRAVLVATDEDIDDVASTTDEVLDDLTDQLDENIDELETKIDDLQTETTTQDLLIEE
jgi:hypothetical protein